MKPSQTSPGRAVNGLYPIIRRVRRPLLPVEPESARPAVTPNVPPASSAAPVEHPATSGAKQEDANEKNTNTET